MNGCLIETDFFISRIKVKNVGENLNKLLNYQDENTQLYLPIKLDIDTREVIVKIRNKMEYEKLNRFLKCENISYEVVNIKGNKELIHERYHHMIEA